MLLNWIFFLNLGMGLVSLERVFPLTLGSNIGTTVTGILASLSGSSKTLMYSLQIALCHTLFNVTGNFFKPNELLWTFFFYRPFSIDMFRSFWYHFQDF